MSSEEAPRVVHRSSPQPLSETVRRQMSAMPTRDAGTEILYDASFKDVGCVSGSRSGRSPGGRTSP
jgi:hypothetical protein